MWAQAIPESRKDETIAGPASLAPMIAPTPIVRRSREPKAVLSVPWTCSSPKALVMSFLVKIKWWYLAISSFILDCDVEIDY
jgi:hypothetical protein